MIEFEAAVPVPKKTGGSESECVDLRRVNAETDSDLFWGLKGAGER